jgi:hypothetical protein
MAALYYFINDAGSCALASRITAALPPERCVYNLNSHTSVIRGQRVWSARAASSCRVVQIVYLQIFHTLSLASRAFKESLRIYAMRAFLSLSCLSHTNRSCHSKHAIGLACHCFFGFCAHEMWLSKQNTATPKVCWVLLLSLGQNQTIFDREKFAARAVYILV